MNNSSGMREKGYVKQSGQHPKALYFTEWSGNSKYCAKNNIQERRGLVRNWSNSDWLYRVIQKQSKICNIISKIKLTVY